MASEQGHTPGPWILGGASGRMITTPSGYVGDGFIADVDTIANARLIAAAPELLSIAKEIVRIDGFIAMHEMFARDWDLLAGAARETIAIATGNLTPEQRRQGLRLAKKRFGFDPKAQA